MVLLRAQANANVCKPMVYPLAGRYVASARLGGPGLLLDGGGTDVDAAWRWMHATLIGSATRRGGNVVVLRATLDNAYSPWILTVAPFASARTITIPPCSTKADIDALSSYVDGADAVFFAGGDQAHYVPWKGTKLLAAVRRVYARGGVVGGTSAGLAIQGAVAFDSVAADRLLTEEDVATPDAVRNPLEPTISFTTGLFAWPPLRDTITDSHFAKRNRFGRLAAFMALIQERRLLAGPLVYGLGIDERSALCVDRNGIATLFEQPARGRYVTQGAYLLTGERAQRPASGMPLWYEVNVARLHVNGEHFDLVHRRGPADRYTVIVDGRRTPPYNRNPYAR
jgi:cyanophycinase